VARFSITDAKTRFSELIQKAIAGEEVIIAKDNKPVVKVSDRDTRQKTRTGIRQRTNLDGGGFRCDPRGFQELQLMRVLLDTHVFLWWQRLLAAQALDEDRGVVSADPVFGKYGVKRIW